MLDANVRIFYKAHAPIESVVLFIIYCHLTIFCYHRVLYTNRMYNDLSTPFTTFLWVSHLKDKSEVKNDENQRHNAVVKQSMEQQINVYLHT